MTLDQIPLFAMLKSKMGYETQRQRVLAENVANSDTPGFAPHDLKAFTFSNALQGAAAAGLGVAPVRTSAMHLAGRAPRAGSAAAGVKSVNAPDSEARLDGNQVVLEEQMMKMSDARADYDAAISLYQQSMTMLRTAARAPGK